MTSIKTENPANNYWIVILLTGVTMAFTVALPTSCMPVLFKEISGDLNLNAVELGTVWGAISLGSIFVMPFGGFICDKLGVKRSLIIIGLLSGITGALRGISTGLIPLIITTLLFGLISAAIMPVISIAGSQAAGKTRQASTQGWISMGGAVGFMLGSLISATWISPLLGGWRYVFFAYGALAILITSVWFFRPETPKPQLQTNSQGVVSVRQMILSPFRIKNLWFIGLALLLFQGCVMGMQGFLPYHLEENGWSVAAASGTIAAYNAMGAVGGVPLTLLSDKLGSRKIFLMISFLVTIFGIGILAVVQDWRLWISVMIVGLFSQMNSALFATLGIEAGQAKSTSPGIAVGFVLGCGLVGRIFAPPLGNSLSGLSNVLSLPFIFWAFLALLGTFVIFFIKEYRK